MVVIDGPVASASVSGIVTVTGWVIDNATVVGTAISSVQVKVDGAVVGNAIYGISRPDVCNAYQGRPGCPNVGYTFQLNTVALSAGSHAITVSATDNDGTPDTGSARVTVNVSPTPPAVTIDAPVTGSVLSGVVTVSGWAIDTISAPGTSIGTVKVKVDGVVVGNAAYGMSRPDVCNAYQGRPNCPNVGYAFQLNTTALAAGSHTLMVLVADTDGTPDTNSAGVTVTVSPIPPLVYIDIPSNGMVVSGTATVSGWAIDDTAAAGTPIGSLQVKVDGTVMGNATYGASRPDVCNAYQGRPNCPNVGFNFQLDTSRLTVGTHMFTVSATDTDIAPDSNSWSTTFQIVGPPSIFIDTPTAASIISGTVTVSGWTLDNTSLTGTTINTVQVKVDGNVVGNATYGVGRPDVCSAFPGRSGCPNVGYTFPLNTNMLSPGPHTVTVSATDSDSPPDTGSASVNVTVAPQPSVFIDAPGAGSVLSGTVMVSGWAIDNTSTAGTAIAGVQVKVDGVLAGTATYGIGRPDVCNALPGRPGCPNVGYSFPLNTAAFSHGTHVITVSATDSDGNPDMGSATVTVNW